MKLTHRTWVAFVIASLGLYLGLPDRGLAQNDKKVKLGVPNGTYVFNITGYLTGPTGNLLPLAAAGVVTYSDNGTTSGVTAFSVDGQVQSRIGFVGTFTVNGDGSVSETDTQTSGPMETLHFNVYPTPDGNALTIVQTDPGAIASGFDTRGR